MLNIKDTIVLVSKLPDSPKKKHWMDTIKKDADKYLELSIEALLALGASLGVSMTIPFKNGDISWRDADAQMTAAMMVKALLLVSVGAVFVVGKPYIDIVSLITSIEREMIPEKAKVTMRSKRPLK